MNHLRQSQWPSLLQGDGLHPEIGGSYGASAGLSSSSTARSAAAMALSRPLPEPEDKPDRSMRGGPFTLPFVVPLLESAGSLGMSASDGLGLHSARDTPDSESSAGSSREELARQHAQGTPQQYSGMLHRCQAWLSGTSHAGTEPCRHHICTAHAKQPSCSAGKATLTRVICLHTLYLASWVRCFRRRTAHYALPALPTHDQTPSAQSSTMLAARNSHTQCMRP